MKKDFGTLNEGYINYNHLFLNNILLSLIISFYNAIYFFFKLRNSKEKICFISRQSNSVLLEFQMLIDGLQKKTKNVEIIVLCKRMSKKKKNWFSYIFFLIKCSYHLSNSKLCFTDGYNIPISVLKHKDELVIIQLWHALGAIKQFGYQTMDKDYGYPKKLIECMNMHKNYSYVMSSSKETSIFFQKAFNIDKNKIKNLGMPRIDYLRSVDNLDCSVDLNLDPNKKTILYAPTFRISQNIPYQELINAVDFNKFNLIIKPHYLDKSKIVDKRIFVSKHTLVFDLLKKADYVITDYSSISIEASLMNKKLFFWVYDMKEYISKCGLNINLYDEFPNCTHENIEEIVKMIHGNYDLQNVEKFKNKYVEANNCNENIIDFALKESKIEISKENIL